MYVSVVKGGVDHDQFIPKEASQLRILFWRGGGGSIISKKETGAKARTTCEGVFLIMGLTGSGSNQ